MADFEEQKQLLKDLADALFSVAVNASKFSEASKEISNSSKSVEERINYLKKEFGPASTEIEKFAKSLESLSKSDANEYLASLGTALGKFNSSLAGWGRSMQLAGNTMMSFSGATNAMLTGVGRISSGLDSVRKTAIEWGNQVYLGGLSLQAFSSSFISAASAARMYEGAVRGVMSRTKLGWQGSIAVFETFSRSFRGFRDQSLKNIEDISAAIGNLGLTPEQAQRLSSQIAPMIGQNRYLMEVASAGITSEGRYGAGERLTSSGTAAVLMRELYAGRLSSEQTEAWMTLIQEARNRATEDVNRSRDTAERSQEVFATREIMQTEIRRVRAEDDIVAAIDRTEIAINELGTAAAEPAGRLANLTHLLGSAGAALTSTGGLLSLFKSPVRALGSAIGLTTPQGSEIGGPLAGSGLKMDPNSGALLVKNVGGSSEATNTISNVVTTGMMASLLGRTPAIATTGTSAATVSHLARIGKFLGRWSPWLAGIGIAYDTVANYGEGRQGGVDLGYSESQSTGRGAISAAGTAIGGGLGIWGGMAAGSFFGPIGTAIGGLIGALGGTQLGQSITEGAYDFFTVSPEERAEQQIEERRQAVSAGSGEAARNVLRTPGGLNLSEAIRAFNDNLSETDDMFTDTATAMMEYNSVFEETIKLTEDAAGAYGRLADAAKFFLNGAQAQMALAEKAEAERSRAQIASGLLEQARRHRERVLANPESTEEERNAATISVADLQSQVQQYQASALQAQMESVEAVGAMRYEISSRQATVAGQTRDLNRELRMGLGVSYRDTMVAVGAQMSALGDKQTQLNAEMINYQITQDEQGRQRIYARMLDLQSEILGLRISVVKELQAVREGYLDAFEEVMVGEGAFARIMPTQDAGTQAFAPASSLGATQGYMGFPRMSGLQETAVMTMSGLQMSSENLSRQHQIYNAMFADLQGFLPGIMQNNLPGGIDALNVMMTSGQFQSAAPAGTAIGISGNLPYVQNFGAGQPNMSNQVFGSGGFGGILRGVTLNGVPSIANPNAVGFANNISLQDIAGGNQQTLEDIRSGIQEQGSQFANSLGQSFGQDQNVLRVFITNSATNPVPVYMSDQGVATYSVSPTDREESDETESGFSATGSAFMGLGARQTPATARSATGDLTQTINSKSNIGAALGFILGFPLGGGVAGAGIGSALGALSGAFSGGRGIIGTFNELRSEFLQQSGNAWTAPRPAQTTPSITLGNIEQIIPEIPRPLLGPGLEGPTEEEYLNIVARATALRNERDINAGRQPAPRGYGVTFTFRGSPSLSQSIPWYDVRRWDPSADREVAAGEYTIINERAAFIRNQLAINAGLEPPPRGYQNSSLFPNDYYDTNIWSRNGSENVNVTGTAVVQITLNGSPAGQVAVQLRNNSSPVMPQNASGESVTQ